MHTLLNEHNNTVTKRPYGAPGMDFGLLAGVLALIACGLPAIYSASHITDGAGKVLRQGIWAGAGLAALLVMACVDYRIWTRYWRIFYLCVITALIAIFFTRPINGARCWFDIGAFRLQPSEFAKVFLILAFAALLVRCGAKLSVIPVFLRCLVFFAFPILLVLEQPDLGMAVIMCVIGFAMVAFAGARWWLLLGTCLCAALFVALAWNARLPGGHHLIKDYQKRRLDFLHADPAGSGYHQRQARIAIGAGELWGKGYLRGTQARRGFLPEQDTDFIFAVIGEEFGLLGCVLVLGLQLFVLFRILRIAEQAETPFGQLVAGGVAAMLAMHAVINIGMCLTLLPVSGVPLPFISYGGSNLMTNLMAIGLVLNISRHRQSQREWAPTEELVRL